MRAVPEPPITVEEQPDPRDVAFLRERVVEFNEDTTGFRDGRDLACFVRDAAGRVTAGLSGFTWGGYCKVEWLWVAEPLRRAGLGRRLMEAAEREASARGCATILVDTHDFQAPGFYARLGYDAIGRADGCPRGAGQTWFQKRLTFPSARPTPGSSDPGR